MRKKATTVLEWRGQGLTKFITSATKGEGGYVFTPLLSVCLCAGYLKKLWTDPDEILWTEGYDKKVCDKDKLIRFW